MKKTFHQGLRVTLLLVILLVTLGTENVQTAYAVTCYDLEIISSPTVGGTVTADLLPNCGSQYNADTAVMLTAAPAPAPAPTPDDLDPVQEYRFVGWAEKVGEEIIPIGTTDPSIIIDMTGKRIIIAKFAPTNDDIGILGGGSPIGARTIKGLTYNHIVATTQAANDDPYIAPTRESCTGTKPPGSDLNEGYKSLWYTYTPRANESIQADTFGSYPLDAPDQDFDTYIVIWKKVGGTEGAPILELVDCNDDIGEVVSRLTIPGIKGTTYYFEIAQYNGIVGPPSDIDPAGANLVFNVNITNTDVYIGGNLRTSYYLSNTSTTTDNYPGIFNGPLQVKNITGDPFIATERTMYGSTFHETRGIPANKLTTEYWFPWYDFSVMQTWISVGNPSPSQNANVSVYIAGQFKESMSIPPNGRWTPSYPGVFDGPVQVKSTAVLETAVTPSNVPGILILVSERTLFGQNFNETNGIPANQLVSEYWFPWYDFKVMKTWISIGNPSSSQTANVSVYIAGQFKESKAILPNGRWTPYYPDVFTGPVQVKSTAVLETVGGQSNVAGIPIIATERTLYGMSFNETPGIPLSDLTTNYWLPVYDSQTMQTWVSIGNPSATQSANVSIYIGGQFKESKAIEPNGKWTPIYSGVSGGPMQVKSTAVLETPENPSNVPGQPVFVSARTLLGTSFSETNAIPANQLVSEYWFTWYDFAIMQTWLSIAKP